MAKKVSKCYIALVLDAHDREYLLEKFPPKNPDVIAHHVTVVYGVDVETPLPDINHVKVVGYSYSDGIEALIVTVHNNILREDGEIYHITWSLDRSRGFVPKDSKTLILNNSFTKINEGKFVKVVPTRYVI